MSATYKGITVPEYEDHADGPKSYRDIIDGVDHLYLKIRDAAVIGTLKATGDISTTGSLRAGNSKWIIWTHATEDDWWSNIEADGRLRFFVHGQEVFSLSPDADARFRRGLHVTGDLTMGSNGKIGGPGVILLEKTFVSTKVANNTEVSSFVIRNPKIPGGCTVIIETIGVAGYDSRESEVSVNLEGASSVIAQLTHAPAAKWTSYHARGIHRFATDTAPDKLIKVRSRSTPGSAYFNGLTKAWVAGKFT